MLDPPTYPNGRLTYNSATNVVTYGCDAGYTPNITGTVTQRTCQSDNQWSGTVPVVICIGKQLQVDYDLID